jgi:predicted nucleic acid-binding protein
VLDELARVLIGKLRFSDEKARAATDLVSQIAVVIPATPIAVEPITEDAADNSILACALEAKADIVATGDRKHLLPLGEHRGVRLLTPQAALAALRTGG